MVTAIDAARFLISLDNEGKYFNKNLVRHNNADFYEGNARLNKILHLAQNMYIGKTGEKLISDDFYAYANGSVLLDVQENYSMLLGTKDKASFIVDDYAMDYLHRVFEMLKDAPLNDLIDIDHEDPAWLEKQSSSNRKFEQRMDSMKHAEDYKSKYEAANFYLDKMVVA